MKAKLITAGLVVFGLFIAWHTVKALIVPIAIFCIVAAGIWGYRQIKSK